MMRWISDLIAILIVALVVGWVGIQYGRQTRSSSSAPPRSFIPGASVTVESLRTGSLPVPVVGFGTVSAVPGTAHKYSLAVEALVDRVAVVPGESVEPGQPLLHVSLSPQGALALRQARAELTQAQKAYELALGRFEMQLGSKAEVGQTKGAVVLASAVLESLESSGLVDSTDILATEPGIVTSLPWSPGSLVGAGAPLVELTSLGDLQATIWIEPEDSRGLSVGAPIELTSVGGGAPRSATGQLTMISSEVDPSTLLVRVAASLGDGGFLLGQALRGELVVRTDPGLLVSRSALVVRGDTLAVFRIDGGLAHEEQVQLLGESADLALIACKGLASGAAIVVAGAAGLSDGTTVSVQP